MSLRPGTLGPGGTPSCACTRSSFSPAAIIPRWKSKSTKRSKSWTIAYRGTSRSMRSRRLEKLFCAHTYHSLVKTPKSWSEILQNTMFQTTQWLHLRHSQDRAMWSNCEGCVSVTSLGWLCVEVYLGPGCYLPVVPSKDTFLLWCKTETPGDSKSFQFEAPSIDRLGSSVRSPCYRWWRSLKCRGWRG